MYFKAESRKGQVGVGWGWGGDGLGMGWGPQAWSTLITPREGCQALPTSDPTCSLHCRFPLSFGHRQSSAGIQYSRIEVSAAS